ncbi:hypothetical protein FCH79_22245 [Pseudomonas koreensis]|nr:hypothetical protein [Pseudomonas koreensis]
MDWTGIVVVCEAAIAGKPAPTGFLGVAGTAGTPQKRWELACQRWRRHIQPLHDLTHRFREQARSHK